jgi:HSP20 family protein
MADESTNRPAATGEAKQEPNDIKVSETQTSADAESQAGGEGKPDQRKGALASLADVEQEVEKAFEKFFRGGWLPSFREWPATFPSLKDTFEGRTPKIDVLDRDDHVVVEAELPGVKKSDIEVSLGDGRITVKASTRRETSEEEGDYHRREISRGVYARTVSLPAPVDGSRATAAYEDGVLKVTLPKLEGAKRQSIEVR